MRRLLTSTSLALALGMTAPALPAFAQSEGEAAQNDAPAAETTAAEATTAETAQGQQDSDGQDGQRMVLGKSGGHGRVAFMASYDEDGDGVVTRGDYFAIRDQRFRDADADGNGVLTEQEYLDEFEARLAADYAAAGREPDEAYQSNLEQTIDRFHLLDLDKDGRMDAGEYFAQASKTFGRVDTNGDGRADADDPDPERRPPVTEADFSAPVPFAGRIGASGPDEGPVLAGAVVAISGRGLPPGQRLTLQRGTTVLNDAPLKVGEDGGFRFAFTLPEDAAPGLYPLLVIGEDPVSVTTHELKISPDLAPMGEHLFQKTSVKGPEGLYQSAYSPASDALFVAATAFAGGPGGQIASSLARLSPDTLETQAEIAIPAAEGSDGTDMADTPAVFGIAVDDERGTVWVTNTIQGSAAVYNQSDLSLIRQFEPGLIGHSREVVVDGARGRACVSGSASNEIAIFDTEGPDYRTTVHVRSEERGKEFTAMGLALDPASGHVYTISRTSAEIAEIDPEAGEVVRIIAVPGIANGAGLAFDAEAGRLLAVSQDSDDLIAVDAQSGEVAFRTPVGAGPLSVTVADGRAFVANRGAGTVTVVDGAGEVVANLPLGSFPNHVATDGKGGVFVLNKSRGPEDDSGDHVTRLQ